MAAAEVLAATISDGELIDRVLMGDRDAFETLYNRYFPRVFAFLQKRLNNRADTEETVQEVFINVFSSLASFRGESPFGAWVLGVSRRTLANRFKKKRHQTVPLDYEDTHDYSDSNNPSIPRSISPLEAYECNERIHQLYATATETLSPEQQQLFEMHHIRHKTIHEIAQDLNKSEDAVKSNLYRARKLLLA
jgi:RNA polymerase sigma-70 factor (ECF subfamily)